MFKLVLEKAEEPEIKLQTSAGSWKKHASSRKTSISALLTCQSPKTSISALLTMPKPLCGSQQTGKFLKRWEYQITLLTPRNLYAGQEATVRTGHGTMDWFQIGKGGGGQVCILSPCLFNLYAEYIMRNAGLDETGNSDRLLLGAPKSLQMVITAMKLKDACSLEEKLWPT